MHNLSRYRIAAVHLALWALVALLIVPALGAGGFWWTDETRHAMGGVFILDVIRDRPLTVPMAYAMRYFAQYPALALNWYLPGFYAIEAAFYAIFGISETAAHGAILGCCLIAASAWFQWSRRTWGGLAALLATALYLSTPIWNYWARSVMLEAPAVAMWVLSIWGFERYLEKPAVSRAIVAGLIFAAAILVKQVVVLLLPAVFIYALWSPRRVFLVRWQALPAYLFIVVALTITALHAVKFGAQGLAATTEDGLATVGLAASRFSVERWLLYPNMLVHTWGWPLLTLSIAGVVWPTKGNESGLPLLYAWLVCWYVSASMLFGSPALENAGRYTVYVIPALAAFAARPIYLLRHRTKPRALFSVAVLIAIGFNAVQSHLLVIPHVDGYRAAAEFVNQKQTAGPVLFAGKYDGSFIFHLRKLNENRDDMVLRADKILVSLAVNKEFGVTSYVGSTDDILKIIDNYGVEYILIEVPDLIKLKEFSLLKDLMQESMFEKISTIPITSTGGISSPARLEIYRYRNYLNKTNNEIIIPMPHLKQDIRFKKNTRTPRVP